jgi:Mg2+-importing ATPase
MGDGINDAPALRAADVGISVDTAADITKDASTIILLEKSLQVLETGVIEGRKVFSNMMKYIRITLSSNFGYVFSVLVASAFLPFLPMLSTQLLTLNLIYDISQLTTPWDNVDAEEIARPVQWGTRGLAKFAVTLGPLSSIFDITTFIVLWFVLGYHSAQHAALFQAGWFIESLATQAMAFHILRTRKIPFIESRAALPIFLSTIGAFVVGGLMIGTPIGQAISLSHVEPRFLVWWVGIVIAYIIVLQVGKWIYYKRNPRFD